VRWGCAGSWVPATESAIFYLAYAVELLWMMRKACNFGPLSALLYPLHLLLVLTHMARSVTWKGRRISLPDHRD